MIADKVRSQVKNSLGRVPDIIKADVEQLFRTAGLSALEGINAMLCNVKIDEILVKIKMEVPGERIDY